MPALVVFACCTYLVDCVLFTRFLDMPALRLMVRLLLITILTLGVAMVGSLIQFFYGDWLFINSWGTRDLFLATAAISLPFAYVALPRMEFPKFFSLVVLGKFLGTLLFTVLIWQWPQSIGLGPDTMHELEAEAIDNAYIIKAAIEKFRTNHNGEVPRYLYGGDAASWRGVPLTGMNLGPDRLLQEGLLEAYPRNPLHLHRAYMPGRQVWTLPGLFLGTKEAAFVRIRSQWLPLLKAPEEPRFGIQGVRMGNIEASPRDTLGALIESNRPESAELPLPGGFYYRSFVQQPGRMPTGYVLAVYGAETHPGLDVGAANRPLLQSPVLSGRNWEVIRDGLPDGVIWITYGGFLADVIAPSTEVMSFD